MVDPKSHSVADLKLEFRVPIHEDLVALFEQLHKQSNISYSRKQFRLTDTSTHKVSTCYICPCETSLSILWSKPSFLSSSKKYKSEVQKQVQDIILNTYLGEIPIGTAFIIEVGPNCLICFTIMGMAKLEHFDPIYIYSSFRAALLEIRRYNVRVMLNNQKKGGSLSEGCIEKIITPLFPNYFEQISVHPENSPVTPLDRSRQSAWQMSLAYMRCKGLDDDDMTKMLLSTEKSLFSRPSWSAQQSEVFLASIILAGHLPKRGIYDTQEVHQILKWIELGQDREGVQFAQALADYLLQSKVSKRQVSEQQVRESVLLALKQDEIEGAKAFLRMACEGTISIVPKITFSELEIQDAIATGATASVHKAIYHGRPVAIKQFHEGVNMNEFNKEVTIMSLLRNPSLVGLISAGVHDQCAYIITELYSQGNLYDYLRRDSNPIPHELAVGFLLDISSGMSYLHSVGIVHRDLKSLNILMSNNHCKITDYGTSRFINQSTHMTGNVGTGPWMAPEVFNNKYYTEKADVYSFGVLMYEILTKKQPFHDQPSFNIAIIVTKGGRPTIPKDMPKHWVKLMKDCWHEKPSKRPPFPKISKILVNLLQNK